MAARIIIVALALAALTGTATARERKPAPLTERQAKELATALDGKTAGRPEYCVSRVIGRDGLHPVGDGILLYRINRDLVYRNDLSGQCSGIGQGQTLILQPTNDQYCRGDIAFALDLTTGMRGASCLLGSFVPYRTAGK